MASSSRSRSADVLTRGLLLAVCAAGCGVTDNDPDPGLYRATIDTPVGELPFALVLEATEADAWQIFLLDGTQRSPAERVTRSEDAIEVQLPGGETTLAFTARSGKLAGALQLAGSQGDRQSLDFSAESGLAFRFFAESLTDNADVAGRWSTSDIDRGGAARGLVADLRQSHDQLTGILYGPAGSQQAVTGQVHGDEVRLSSFDGRTALLVSATVNRAGDLEGEYWSSETGTADFTATRNPDAEAGF